MSEDNPQPSADRGSFALAEQPLADRIRRAGIAGAGGAGFPAYAKWERVDEVDSLLINHQESEPDFSKDRWIGRTQAGTLAAFCEALLETVLDRVVIGTKQHYRGVWLGALEEATDATVYEPDELPIDDRETGVIVACTDDRYEYGMESVLLRTVNDTVIGRDLPMDHGWIVQNTETLYNIALALSEDRPVTHKFVHVDGDTPRHRFLRVPVGTLATDLLAVAGRPGGPGSHEILADGGPGWSFEIERDPDMFGVTKRTNCLLIIDEALAEDNRIANGRINILGPQAWKGRSLEDEPTDLEPDRVRIPLLSNADYEGIADYADPTVSPGEDVTVGDRVAKPTADAISNAHHASIDGEVTAVTEHHVTIERQ
ncbi:NADH dehydrogenase subunit [Halorhabdus rudnickae]|uniref:NADH dehydrogenase subunit n=1 Tax=Halorhabdus rudnickae TaxID=1775544 RepID=UPI00108452C3|nr:NADH dehydrogenase subunit [Halorhabdus rudnickae]